MSKAWEKDSIAPTRKVGVVGVPFSYGQPRRGTEQGPQQLRESGFLDIIKRLGNTVTDHDDISVEEVPDDQPWNKVKRPRTVGKVNKKLADQVAEIKREGQVALTLGGDHSIAIGSIFGHAQVCPDLVVIWVDAHADLNTPESTPSGNMHGMPLSLLVREMQPKERTYAELLPGFHWCRPCISAKDLVYIGLRDVDEGERAYIAQCGIRSYSMQEVDRYGLAGLMDRLLEALDPSGIRPIHVSFDVDAMDPEFTPSTGTPVSGGLSRREMLYIAETIVDTGRLSCLDVVEVNPCLGTEDQRRKTIVSTADVVTHFFGKRRQGNVRPTFQLPLPQVA